MTDDIRFSVIVRTFNRPEMLHRALGSISKQTWPHREAVVINDGGESVADLVGQFEGKLDIVLREFSPDEKPGRCLAQVRGVEVSTGNWITYCDDDDLYYPDHLETLATAIGQTDKLVLYTDANCAREQRNEDGSYEIIKVTPGPSLEFSRAEFYNSCYIHLSTFCHHRSVFDDLGGFDPELPVLEDLDLFFRYAHDHVFHHVKKITAQYHIRTDRSNAVTAMRMEFQDTQELLAKKYLHLGVKDLFKLVSAGRADMYQAMEAFQQSVESANALTARIEALERRVAELEGRS